MELIDRGYRFGSIPADLHQAMNKFVHLFIFPPGLEAVSRDEAVRTLGKCALERNVISSTWRLLVRLVTLARIEDHNMVGRLWQIHAQTMLRTCIHKSCQIMYSSAVDQLVTLP